MKTILGNMVFSNGFKKTDTIKFCGKTKKITIKLKAYYEKDGITAAQEKALKKYNDKRSAIDDKFTKLATKYDSNAAKRFVPRTLLFGRDGECALLCDDNDAPDEGIAVCVFPKEEVVSQDDYL